MSSQTPPLEELMEFPSRYTFRAIAAADPGLVDRLSGLLEAALGRAAVGNTQRPHGRWISVRLTAVVESADEVRAVYVALRGDAAVRMVL